MKKWFNKLIKNIEKANTQNFGAGRLDCCDLNVRSNHNTHITKEIKGTKRH